MSIYDAGDIIKGKTMNLIVTRLDDKDLCMKVCEFSKSNCRNMYRELDKLDIKSIACTDITCTDIIGNCYFKKLDGGL